MLRAMHAKVVVFNACMLLLATGCATEPKPMTTSPVPGGRADALVLRYVYPVSAPKAYEAMLGVLSANFGSSMDFAEKENPEKVQQFRRFGEMHTKFAEYQEKGKKYRKQCDSYIRLVPERPNYTEVSVGCKRDVYEFGFARGGIHNLFTQWWGWYPEDHLHLSEEVLERVRESLGLQANEVIRLSNTKVNELRDILAAIREFEVQKKQK